MRAKLFNFKVDFRRSRIIRTPDLNDVTPLIQANSKQTKREIQKAKSDLQQRWKTAIFECYAKDEFTNMFRKYVQRFVNRFEPLKKEYDFFGCHTQPRLPELEPTGITI